MSLDDPVVKYLPELNNEPDFKRLTLRNLMEMNSGFAYERTNGSMWHDLSSDDAKFYYTTNMKDLLKYMRRVQNPPAPWAYKDSDVELLGWILSKAGGKSVAMQVEEEMRKKIVSRRKVAEANALNQMAGERYPDHSRSP